MTAPFATRLENRGVIRIGGEDRHTFLQGLVSNDVTKAGQGIYAALLTPQGKFLHDLFILDTADGFLVDCEAARAEDLLRRLSAYKLRSKVTFENLADKYDVWSVSPKGKQEGCHFYIDPRLRGMPNPNIGRIIDMARTIAPKGVRLDGQATTVFDVYDQLRLKLGFPDGSRDMEIEKSTLADGNFDFLNGIDWKKGCYIGQELTARMHHRGLVKKRLFPVRIEGTAPEFGAILQFGGEEVGEMRSSKGSLGLALLKIEAVQRSLAQEIMLTNAETRLFPAVPAWMKIDATAPNS